MKKNEDKKIRRCTKCRRELKICNRNPCTEKLIARKDRENRKIGHTPPSKTKTTTTTTTTTTKTCNPFPLTPSVDEAEQVLTKAMSRLNLRINATPFYPSQYTQEITTLPSLYYNHPPYQQHYTSPLPPSTTSHHYNYHPSPIPTGSSTYTCDPTDLHKIDLLNKRNLIVGKTHWCEVLGYSPFGFFVEVYVETGAHEEVETFRSFIRWNYILITSIWPDHSRCVEEARRRVPLGSRFKVYSPGIDEFGDTGVRLKMARWPTINLAKHPPLPLRSFTSSFPIYSNSHGLNINQTSSPFQYLVIIDFEATCDYAPIPEVTVDTSEIIEFPWIIYDLKTREIIHEERYYVQPTNIKGVTEHCTALTGITKDMVQHCMFLKDVIDKFAEFVSIHFPDSIEGVEKCNSFRIVTDGIWDLQVQLLRECNEKGIVRDWWFKEYFNLKDEFRSFLPYFEWQKGPTLRSMIDGIQSDFVGRHHCGLDDCKSICKIVQYMVERGYIFNTPISIPESYNPMTDDRWNHFISEAEDGAWICPKGDCGLWNRPYRTTCLFCDTTKTL